MALPRQKPFSIEDPLSGGSTMIPPPTMGPTGVSLGTPLAPQALMPGPTVQRDGGVEEPPPRPIDPGFWNQDPTQPEQPVVTGDPEPPLPYDAGFEWPYDVNPYDPLDTFQWDPQMGDYGGIWPQLQEQILAQLQDPGMIDTDLFQNLYGTAMGLVDEQYGAAQRGLEANLAGRGLDYGSTAAGALSDIATQRGRAGQEVMQNLMYQEWNNMAALRDASVRNALNTMGFQEGAMSQDLQRQMAAQGQTYGQQSGERAWQDYQMQNARQQAMQDYAMQQEAWQGAVGAWQGWVNNLMASGVDMANLSQEAVADSIRGYLEAAGIYGDELEAWSQALMMMWMMAIPAFGEI
jgi:hypothetical protein